MIMRTPIQYLGFEYGNELYVKRDDLLPFSFGGNKARKAELFFDEIDKGKYDCIVTYGSSSSNHCRVVSNMACSRKLPCYIISPEEASDSTYNSQMMKMFDADVQIVPVDKVHETIEKVVGYLKEKGFRPYFIPGGGHGNIGTQAYVNCYEEIKEYEKTENICFDYIFQASGTGTTQAGLVCGQIMNRDKRLIVGISIARKNPRGREIVLESIREYLGDKEDIDKNVIFTDKYIGKGYGDSNTDETIDYVLRQYGLPLDSIYTGKAFCGMKQYLEENAVRDKKVLFIHTGGTPLFFDYLKRK